MCIRDRDKAIQSLTTAIKWYEAQDEEELPKIISLLQIHSLALEMYGQQKKQKKIRFFQNH